MPRKRLVLAALGALFALPQATAHALVDLTVPAARDTEPVVLTGADFGSWAVPANQTLRLPLLDLATPPEDPHNHYAEPNLDTASSTPAGVPTGQLLAYRWNRFISRFEQIPFQVDERFERYLNNTASGFALYSGEDKHTTYAYDREGFRYTVDGPADDPCTARPASPEALDPVAGLDTNDEVAFMASDAATRAPLGRPLPAGIVESKEVVVADPLQPLAAPRYVYIMRAAANGPRPAFNGSNGYVRYQRDARTAEYFEFSESSYDDYGNAKTGYYCDAAGNIVRNEDGTPKIGRRRPRDTASITTSRYSYRYDGRWLMTAIRVSGDGKTYGPDLVDRWKARAFQQDPSSDTPCCGYEEEDTNWGGSSTLLGERVGPVRAIRETWGADSGTNVIRRETFYRDEVQQRSWLRVHVIPPLDGIYAQWDFNAGIVDRFYNSALPAAGVAVDGRNDEVFGNFDDPCNELYDANDTSEVDQTYRSFYRQSGLCDINEYHQSIDLPDLTSSEPGAGTGWSVTTGDHGTVVDRISTSIRDVTPGGAAQSLLAVPYYRDDSCFDDGTGTNPGPRIRLRSREEERNWGGEPRKCWRPEDGAPNDDPRYFQGSIGTHGLHLLALVDSDNARLTAPVNEIVSDWRMVMLPGRRDASAGERYGRGFEKPLVALVTSRLL